MEDVKVGSKWVSKVDLPHLLGVCKGDTVVVSVNPLISYIYEYESRGKKWACFKEDWHEYFVPAAGGSDNVNNPSHYGQGKIEAIEYISDFLTKEEYQGYLRGNIAKYLHRFPYKNGLEDLKKARWYLERLIQEVDTPE